MLLFFSYSLNAHNYQQIIDEHYQKFHKLENFTAIQVSIKSDIEIENYCSGKDLTPKSLFNLGSITKSFTAVLVLLAQRDNLLKLADPLEKFLKNYKNWNLISIKQLLNMISGLPNYSNSAKFNFQLSQNLKQYWNNIDLINLVYTPCCKPPLKSGYYYTNTGYVLIDLILTKIYKKPYQELLLTKILQPLNIVNIHYPLPNFSKKILKNLVKAYSYNPYDNPRLVGSEVSTNNLSWAGAAGGLVGNSEDIVRWVDGLFNSNKILNKAEIKQMQQLVSVTTGQNLNDVDKNNPQGFGLGLIKTFKPEIGKFWFYQGQTIGYRAIYMYVPCNKVIISALFNSSVSSNNDKAHLLLEKLYQEVLRSKNIKNCGLMQKIY